MFKRRCFPPRVSDRSATRSPPWSWLKIPPWVRVSHSYPLRRVVLPVCRRCHRNTSQVPIFFPVESPSAEAKTTNGNITWHQDRLRHRMRNEEPLDFHLKAGTNQPVIFSLLINQSSETDGGLFNTLFNSLFLHIIHVQFFPYLISDGKKKSWPWLFSRLHEKNNSLVSPAEGDTSSF